MKTSLVTGGASGIGLELVKLLSKDNYKVFVVDYNKENLKKLSSALDSNNYKCIEEDFLFYFSRK